MITQTAVMYKTVSISRRYAVFIIVLIVLASPMR